ncbi:MAG: outer membrane beta-barrel protein [Alphaproteobacteria bacterium]|nr:outer membrane beta-barrel protein [Alphaproteobacteria bacterium]
MHIDRLQLLAAIGFLAAATSCAPNVAQKKFTEIHSGPSQTEVDSVEIERPVSFDVPGPATHGADQGSALPPEGRFGMWFNEWGGLALDGPLLQSDGDGLNNDVLSATPLLLLRIRFLKSGNVPDGQMQPYLGIGPGIFLTGQKANFRRDIDGKIDTGHMAVGVDLRAGMRWQLSSRLGVYGEYRMTHYKTDTTDNNKTASVISEHGKTSLTTNHIMGGLTFAF